jgi:DNA-directed RNA polymerase III subunit RPC8
LVRIRPEDFSKRTIEALEDNLNEKYANKVIQNIGLAICVYDILWAGDDTGIISQGDGYANVNGVCSRHRPDGPISDLL